MGVIGAAQPVALAHLAGGLWELTGVPGSRTPVRQCLTDMMVLAQFEHRGRNCSRTVVSDAGNSSVISYNCGAAGFGQSQIDVLTPRSLRISTQGISGQLPFGYTLQAHRIGDCRNPSPPLH